MSWAIEERAGTLVVTMNSNPVNKQNAAFFADLHACFDRLDREFEKRPIVLTGQGSAFSAGLDFGEVFEFLDKATVADASMWFGRYYQVISRVLTAPRMVVGAINGHAYAGGAVLAMACDYRIGPTEGARAALNEVPIGIPMPVPYVELARERLGYRHASEWILFGREYGPGDAHRAGFFHELAPVERVVERAIAVAGSLSPLAQDAYITSKRALLAPLLAQIDHLSPQIGPHTIEALLSDAGKKARAHAKAALAARRTVT